MAKSRPEPEEEREERIAMEIIVDCYNESEAWSSWCCYLEDKLAFPFEAVCIAARKRSPLKVGEKATVTGMLDDENNRPREMEVEIRWGDRTIGVPLAQLQGVHVDEATAEAIADWHYWVAQGREF
ncbi:calcium-binding protein [Verrucomicrobia bacterium LW23]|nr:calcium-binding protein [Verrucomicrobia bacterium LW23]